MTKCRIFLEARYLGLVNKLSSIFGWLRLRLAVSAKLGLPTSRPALMIDNASVSVSLFGGSFNKSLTEKILY